MSKAKNRTIIKSGSRQCRTLAIVNQKGGVGKTTTTINLATALAAVGKKTLLLDLDPQGNASTGVGINPADREVDIYQVLLGDASITEAVYSTAIPLLSVIPATIDLSAAEVELIPVSKREFVLRNTIQQLAGSYDYILIDCPPSLGMLTINALVAADALLIPLQCEFFALEGLSHLLRTVQLVKDNLNADLDIQGIVLTMYDRRNRLTEQVETDVRGHFGKLVYQTVIPRNVRISEAPSHGKPAIIYDIKCPGSTAYLHLAKEVLKREKEEVIAA